MEIVCCLVFIIKIICMVTQRILIKPLNRIIDSIVERFTRDPPVRRINYNWLLTGWSDLSSVIYDERLSQIHIIGNVIRTQKKDMEAA